MEGWCIVLAVHERAVLLNIIHYVALKKKVGVGVRKCFTLHNLDAELRGK